MAPPRTIFVARPSVQQWPLIQRDGLRIQFRISDEKDVDEVQLSSLMPEHLHLNHFQASGYRGHSRCHSEVPHLLDPNIPSLSFEEVDPSQSLESAPSPQSVLSCFPAESSRSPPHVPILDPQPQPKRGSHSRQKSHRRSSFVFIG
jgi:hypothetical protein